MNPRLVGNITKAVVTFGVSMAIGEVIQKIGMKVYDKLVEDRDWIANQSVTLNDILLAVGVVILTWTVTSALVDMATEDFNAFVDAVVEQIEASREIVEEIVE